MKRKQISVFIQNEPGHLGSILEALEKQKVSILALSVSDTSEFGIVRMIVDDADKGLQAIRQAGFTARVDALLGYNIPDVPGGLLNSVIKPLAAAGINIKYFYAYFERGPQAQATVVFKPDNIDKAEAILKAQLAGK
ncbi:MAG: amino acid-binding protein [Dehalococcoidia bacterium]|jgi:hypothetical protein